MRSKVFLYLVVNIAHNGIPKGSILSYSILGINVYSSKDLLNWKNEGKALSPINGTEIAPERVVERPKVVYNEPTKTWVVRCCL